MLNVRYPTKVAKNPTRIIIDSKARIPLDSRIIESSKKIQTIIAVTHKASFKKIQQLQNKGVQVLVSGNRKVNIRNLFQQLEKMGLKKIIVEGVRPEQDPRLFRVARAAPEKLRRQPVQLGEGDIERMLLFQAQIG